MSLTEPVKSPPWAGAQRDSTNPISPLKTYERFRLARHREPLRIEITMIELDPHNLIEFLAQTGRLAPDIAATSRAETLSGGVSNVVMRVTVPRGDDFVVKQSRAQLRTQAAWFSQPERIWRERDVLVVLQECTPPRLVPKLLFEDHENFLIAMEAIPREHVVWKTCLLNEDVDPSIAYQLGTVLATIHARTANDVRLIDSLGNRTIFDELRLDPFYRFVAARHSELRPALERLIDETMATQVCLVLADFSPKNILIINENVDSNVSREPSPTPRIALVDFETGHFGDPAFDLGFFLSHLLLKTIRSAARSDIFFEMIREFWSAYRTALMNAVSLPDAMQLATYERRIVPHLAACMRARVDGKSTVDYLTNEAQTFIREATTDWLLSPPDRVESVFRDLQMRLRAIYSC